MVTTVSVNLRFLFIVVHTLLIQFSPNSQCALETMDTIRASAPLHVKDLIHSQSGWKMLRAFPNCFQAHYLGVSSKRPGQAKFSALYSTFYLWLVNWLFKGHIWSVRVVLFQLEGSSNEDRNLRVSDLVRRGADALSVWDFVWSTWTLY
jgi:hypothetical protein